MCLQYALQLTPGTSTVFKPGSVAAQDDIKRKSSIYAVDWIVLQTRPETSQNLNIITQIHVLKGQS